MRAITLAYVPGNEIGDAIKVAERFERKGGLSSAAYLNAMGEDPAAIAAVNLQALGDYARPDPRRFLSVKAPALGFDLARIARIAEFARECEACIHFDSHGIDAADRTWDCVEHARRVTPNVGLTIPAAWARSADDAQRALVLGLRHIRVVKGAFDLGDLSHADRRARFLALVENLRGRVMRVGVATHDPQLAQQAIARLRDAGTDCELELLHGLPTRRMLPIAQALGVPARLCVHYGAAWAPYSLAQAARHPQTVAWIVKDIVHGVGGRIKARFAEQTDRS